MQGPEVLTMQMHTARNSLINEVNMNYEDIIALAKAGFNSQQIAQIAQEADKAPAKKEAEVAASVPEQGSPAAQVSPTPAEPAKVSDVPAVTPSAEPSKIDAVLQELAQLKTTIQTSNIRQSNQPARDNVDDILASIIRPTYKNKEE